MRAREAIDIPVQKFQLPQKSKSMSKKGKSYFTKVSKGKLVVFEGIDGSGKTTICRLLINYLKKRKIPFSHYSFPRYDKPWGKLIRRYLDGEFGSVGEVDPYLASVLYAGDRLTAAVKINQDLKAGKIVICDRYTASNIAHQAAKVGSHRGKTFTEWVERFEYENNKIPREDLVLLLSVPPVISQKLMAKKKRDIHERNKKYLENVWQIFEDLAGKKNWRKINCVKNGKLRKPEEIHKEVLEILENRSIL